MKLEFTKMHGLGNDFIVMSALHHSELNELGDDELSDLSVFLCKRRFGIGADQLLVLSPSEKADFRMRIFNADGSEVEMCGNGIRCLARYIWDRGLSTNSLLEIDTLGGVIKPEERNGLVRVDMGEPEFSPDRIPLYLDDDENPLPARDSLIDYPVEIDGNSLKISCVSMGNPHCVIIVQDAKTFPVSYYGPMLENHQLFPKRTNVEFVEVLNKKEVRMRVWERGAGETMACGTGASASGVIAALKGLTERTVTAHLLGGDLIIEWAEDNHVYMTGPAITVFNGVISINK
jgi:diaminopimelate epimerase